MNRKGVHIVAFDVPFPANYGGVIDIFYRIKALSKMNVKIVLHCFVYGGKEPHPELEKYCEQVYYYKRRRFKNPFVGELPYVVTTRNDLELLKNLKQNDWPIFFEGLHCTYFLLHPNLEKRQKIVRMHNVEHLYYRGLENAETSFFKKYFYQVEADRLEKYESVLSASDGIAAISPSETNYYKEDFRNVFYLPAFHSNDHVVSKAGKGEYVLYHGNLAVAENNRAAIFLIENVFSKLKIPCIIAGNNPSAALKAAAKNYPNVKLAFNIAAQEVLRLIEHAHINLLYTFQNTGIKLKLLNALYRGRHCIVNDLMVLNTGLEPYCHIANEDSIQKEIMRLWKLEFTEENVSFRKQLDISEFNNTKNAKDLIERLELDPVEIEKTKV